MATARFLSFNLVSTKTRSIILKDVRNNYRNTLAGCQRCVTRKVMRNAWKLVSKLNRKYLINCLLLLLIIAVNRIYIWIDMNSLNFLFTPSTRNNDDVRERLFELGTFSKGHVRVYTPICIDVTNGHVLSFKGSTVCLGKQYNEAWYEKNCEIIKKTADRFRLLDVERKYEMSAWLHEHSHEVTWIKRLTVLQMLTDDCVNVAHFTRKTLCLHHVLENIELYSGTAPNFQKRTLHPNIVLVANPEMSRRFANPKLFNFYQFDFLRALISPSNFSVGTFGDVQKQMKLQNGDKNTNEPIIYIVNNFSVPLPSATRVNGNYVCFREAIAPSFFKSRFFFQ